MTNSMENLKITTSFHQVGKPYAKIERRKTNAFMILLKGYSVYDFGDKTITVNEGEMIFLPQGANYEYKTFPAGEMMYTSINFVGEFVDAEPRKYSVDGFYETEHIGKNFTDLWNFGGVPEKCKCISLFYSLISYILGIDHAEYSQKRKFDTIEPAVSYLKKNIYDSDLKADKLHSLCGISDTYFRKIFISRFGMPPQKYIISKRISDAKAIMDSGEYDTIQEVASLVGYSDPLYFSKVFKKFYGVSPSLANK